MGVQKTPYQKTYELQAGSQDFTVHFQGANRQFDWIEISLIYDKNDKHLTAYDSYNAECASKFIKSLKFANISDQHISTKTSVVETVFGLVYKRMLDSTRCRFHE